VHREERVVEWFLLDHASVPKAVGRGGWACAGLVHRVTVISKGGNRSIRTLGDNSDFRQDNVSRKWAMQSSVGLKLGVGVGESNSETFSFLSFPFARVVSSGAVPLDTLDPSLLLLIIGLGPLPRR
jgi:hypothetical protein